MRTTNETHTPQFKIGMLLLDGFNSMAMHAFIDPFRSANYLRGTSLYDWEFITLDLSRKNAGFVRA